MRNKRNEWVFRLKQELKSSRNAYFVTLTYADNCLPRSPTGIPQVCKSDVQKFMKRLRKNCDKLIPKDENKKPLYKVRYYLVAEYGGHSGRPHYHALLFNLPCNSTYKGDLEATELIYKSWENGAVHVGTVTGASINYCAAYSIAWNYDKKEGRNRPFMLCSRRPAIGIGFLANSHYNKWLVDSDCLSTVDDQGKRVSIPRIYRVKLITTEEAKYKRQLAIAKLNAMKPKLQLDEQTYGARLEAAYRQLEKQIKKLKLHS